MSGATLVAFINGSTGGAGAGVFDFTEPGTGFIAIPTGATGVAIQVWGAGGGGGAATFGFIAPGEPEIFPGAGGGGGGYAKTVLTFSAQDDKTINYTVGSGGAGGPEGSLTGDAGTFSNVFSGTYTLTTLTGNGGQGGSSGQFPVQGAGGTASGGNTVAGTTGNGGAPFEQTGAAGIAGDASLTAGAGGDGGFSFEGDPGFSGRVRFVFTF
jgi:hypothetical protein